MKKVVILLFLLTSCSQLSFKRSPANFSPCHQLLKDILKDELSYKSQTTLMRKLDAQAMSEAAYFYKNNTLTSLDESEIKLKVTKINLMEMKDIQRGDGVPYATHPLKLSFLSKEIMPKGSESERTFLYTMIHDVLEEGRNTSVQSLNWLRRALPQNKNIADAAYKLVEPDIKEIPLPDDIPYSMIEVVGYGRQIEFFYFQSKDQSLLNASLIDKLFNVFDRYKAVMDNKVTEENFELKMQWRLAKQRFLLEKMKDFAEPRVVQYAQSLHINIREDLGFSKEQISQHVRQYENLEKTYSSQIDAIIEREALKRGLL